MNPEYFRSWVLLGVVLLHPLMAALLPFFVPNYDSYPADYVFDYVSGTRKSTVYMILAYTLHNGSRRKGQCLL